MFVFLLTLLHMAGIYSQNRKEGLKKFWIMRAVIWIRSIIFIFCFEKHTRCVALYSFNVKTLILKKKYDMVILIM